MLLQATIDRYEGMVKIVRMLQTVFKYNLQCVDSMISKGTKLRIPMSEGKYKIYTCKSSPDDKGHVLKFALKAHT